LKIVVTSSGALHGLDVTAAPAPAPSVKVPSGLQLVNNFKMRYSLFEVTQSQSQSQSVSTSAAGESISASGTSHASVGDASSVSGVVADGGDASSVSAAEVAQSIDEWIKNAPLSINEGLNSTFVEEQLTKLKAFESLFERSKVKSRSPPRFLIGVPEFLSFNMADLCRKCGCNQIEIKFTGLVQKPLPELSETELLKVLWPDRVVKKWRSDESQSNALESKKRGREAKEYILQLDDSSSKQELLAEMELSDANLKKRKTELNVEQVKKALAHKQSTLKSDSSLPEVAEK
jgi:hypothetical protein